MHTSTMTRSPGGPTSQSQCRPVFDLCVQKTRANIKRLADEPKAAPVSASGDPFQHKEGFFEIGNWTSSFYTGMALLAWRDTRDAFFLEQVLRLAPAYREKATTRHLDMHHDAGFLYSLYSVALHKLTGDPAHRDVGVAAAEALLERFNPRGNYIRAWGRLGTNDSAHMAIIDCLMNLPLLYWASRETGETRFRDAALRHADTTLRNFVRADGSVCHAYQFDPDTGAPLRPDNHCGHGVESYWARGTTWAIYGFALSHRYTGEERFLDAALRLARAFIGQLDGDVIPVWDFRLPPGRARTRDASAAAVAVCAFQELAALGAADQVIADTKDALLGRLCSEDYLFTGDQSCCVLKSHGGASLHCSSWGDYFLMEALSRHLSPGETFW